jgi:hypothetical protein
MKWIKASEKMPQDLTGGPQPMRGSVLPYRVNGNHVVGRFHYRNDCHFFEYVGMNMHGSMMRSEFHEIEWRDDSDESLPTLEQLQAEAVAKTAFEQLKMAGYPEELSHHHCKGFKVGYVAGASQYAGRVRELEAENKELKATIQRLQGQMERISEYLTHNPANK